MSALLKKVLAMVLGYLRTSPGAVAFIASETVLILAHIGLHLSAKTMYQLMAALLPVILGYFHVAKQGQQRRAVEAVRAETGKNG